MVIPKRQTFIARSSNNAEIGAVDEFTKELQYMTNIFPDLHVLKLVTNSPILIYNEFRPMVTQYDDHRTPLYPNAQKRSERIRSSQLDVAHINGRNNTADSFTKEDKDATQFCEICDVLVGMHIFHSMVWIGTKMTYPLLLPVACKKYLQSIMRWFPHES